MLAGTVSGFSEWDRIPHHCRFWTRTDLAAALRLYRFEPKRWGHAQSAAEGGDIGFNESWLQSFAPDLRNALIRFFMQLPPEERHSFIIVEAQKIDKL